MPGIIDENASALQGAMRNQLAMRGSKTVQALDRQLYRGPNRQAPFLKKHGKGSSFRQLENCKWLSVIVRSRLQNWGDADVVKVGKEPDARLNMRICLFRRLSRDLDQDSLPEILSSFSDPCIAPSALYQAELLYSIADSKNVHNRPAVLEKRDGSTVPSGSMRQKASSRRFSILRRVKIAFRWEVGAGWPLT